MSRSGVVEEELLGPTICLKKATFNQIASLIFVCFSNKAVDSGKKSSH